MKNKNDFWLVKDISGNKHKNINIKLYYYSISRGVKNVGFLFLNKFKTSYLVTYFWTVFTDLLHLEK